MFELKSARNAVATAVIAGICAWTWQALGSPGKQAEQAWSFDMWCVEMQLYAAKRCDARLPEDLREYAAYRSDVEKYRDQERATAKRDSEILQRLNRNVPGAANGPLGR